MAEQFTILPSFVSQESNTAVLKDEGLNSELLQFARLKYGLDEAKHQKDKEAIMNSIDFGSGDMLQSDTDVVNKDTEAFVNWVDENKAELIRGKDLKLIAKWKDWKNDIDNKITVGIGRKQVADKFESYMNSTPDYGTDKDKADLQEFKDTAGKVSFSWSPRDMYNEITFYNNITVPTEENKTDTGTTSTITHETPTKKIASRSFKLMNTPTLFNPFAEHYLKLANLAKQNPTLDKTITYYKMDEYADKGEQAPTYTMNVSEITPDNVKLAVGQKIYIDEAYKKSKSENKTTPTNPKSDDGNGGVKSDLTWVIDGLVDIKKGTGQSTTNTKSSQGKDLKMSNMFIGEQIIDKSDLNSGLKTIATISNKGGKTYVTFVEDQSKTGNAPLRPIENEWNELVLPILKDKYGDKAIEELKQYAKEQGVSSILGIPELKQPTNTTSTTNNTGGASKYNKK